MGTAGVIRTILLVDIVAMALLAIVYLRQRRMSWTAFLCWGLLAACVPVLGPFLVISNRPGEWDPAFSFSDELRRAAEWAKRLLPDPTDRDLPRLARLRKRRQVRNKSTHR